VATSVLDPFDVFEIAVWPAPDADPRRRDADRSRVAALAVVDAFLQRSMARPRVLALSFAALVHVALLIALAWQVRVDVARPPAATVDLQLAPSWPRAIVPAPDRSAERKPAGPPLVNARVESPAAGAETAVPALSSPPAAAAAIRPGVAQPLLQPWQAGDARLSSALRNSLIGCAEADSSALSESEREGCRQRLAQGASTAPYISSVPADKREYYGALVASEDAMRRDPMGGHRPGIICGLGSQNRGFKLGSLPCSFSPSPSPWMPELDVRPR
jgi:hypothetical protein